MSGLICDGELKRMQDTVARLYTDSFDAWRYEQVQDENVYGQVLHLVYDGVPCHLSNDNDYFMDVPDELDDIKSKMDSYTLFAGVDVRLLAGDRVCVHTKGRSVEGIAGTSFVRDVGTQTRVKCRKIVNYD